jgi:hypothetical protein
MSPVMERSPAGVSNETAPADTGTRRIADIPAQGELNGWVIEKRRSRYSLGYWVLFIIGMFAQMVPQPPRITYTVRNSRSGEFGAVTPPGDHAGSDLIGAVANIQTGKSA